MKELEFITEYNEEVIVGYVKADYKASTKLNKKQTILMGLLCLMLGVVGIVANILNSEVYKTLIPGIFFAIMAVVFLISPILYSDKSIRKRVEKSLQKAGSIVTTIKYTFGDDKIVSSKSNGELKSYTYEEIRCYYVFENRIYILLKFKQGYICIDHSQELLDLLISKNICTK